MKIGELATLARTPVETIRYYEREGLLPAAPRSDGNYRIYGREHAERLAFIRHCRTLDMTLDEIRVLRQLEKELKALRERCASPTDSAHCGILSGLQQAATEPAAPARRPHTAGAHGRVPR